MQEASHCVEEQVFIESSMWRSGGFDAGRAEMGKM
jgi:hypothetical protein